MIGRVGPNVSSVMHFIVWSTSTSTVGSKKRPGPLPAWPPVSTRRALVDGVLDVVGDDVQLRREDDRADVDGALLGGDALAQRARRCR